MELREENQNNVIFISGLPRGTNRERKFKHKCESKIEIKFHLLVDCEVVAEGKTVAAPVQRTTRALNTTMSRYFLESFFHVSINDISLG